MLYLRGEGGETGGAPSFKAGRANTRNGGAAAWFSADKTIPVCSSEKRRPLTPCLRQSPSALFIIPIHHKFLPVPVSCFQSLSVMGLSSACFQNKIKSMQRRRSDPSRWSAHSLYVLKKKFDQKTPQKLILKVRRTHLELHSFAALQPFTQLKKMEIWLKAQINTVKCNSSF